MSADNFIKTSIHRWDELDLDELAEFSFEAKQSRPETHNTNSSADEERRIINWRRQFSQSLVIVTRKKKKILGWLSFDLDSTTIMEIGRWLPIILPHKEEAFESMINKCKNYCKRVDYSRIEVSFDIKDRGDRQAYEVYKSLYETNGVRFKDEIIYMNRNLSESDNAEITIPETFKTESILELNDSELYRCYYEAFIQGQDRMFQDQTEEERLEYFYDYYSKSKPLIKEASLVLKKTESDEILGVTLLRPRGEDVHLALLAIHPNYQGKKLGGLLLRLVLKKVFQQGFNTISLSVDIENPAMRIYQKFGFKTQSHIITHSWKNQNF